MGRWWPVRWGLGALGVLAGAYGGWLLTSRLDRDQLVGAGAWLLAGPVLHDFVLTGVLLLVLTLGRRVLPAPVRAPAAVAAVVFGSLTLAVFPVLNDFGDVPAASGVLDRPYWTSWLILAAITAVAVLVAGLVRARRRTPEE